MTVLQPFQYQGSERALAPLILQYLPVSTTRLGEPFGGSAAGPRSAAVPGGGFGHRPGARFWNWRRDAAVTRRRGRLRYDLPMTVLEPFQYQGSERALAPLILQYLPVSTTRRVEPFGGSAASPRSAAVPGGGFGHRLGACSKNSRRDAAATRRRGRLRYE